MTKTMSPEDHLRARIESQRLEIERLRGLKPELPPRAPDGEGLPRYGLRWNGPHEPVTVPMDDGFWTPWHLAAKAPAHEPGVVYRKWPGEPPHCMSCSCGMTDEQKRMVPEADYLRIHKELMDLKYPGSSPEPASRKTDTSTVAGMRRYIFEQLGFLTDDDNRPAEALLRLAAKRLKSEPASWEVRMECLYCPARFMTAWELEVHEKEHAVKSSPADLVGALQDVVHQDTGAVRAGHAVKSRGFVCPTHGPVQQLTDSGDCPMCIQDRTAARTAEQL